MGPGHFFKFFKGYNLAPRPEQCRGAEKPVAKQITRFSTLALTGLLFVRNSLVSEKKRGKTRVTVSSGATPFVELRRVAAGLRRGLAAPAGSDL